VRSILEFLFEKHLFFVDFHLPPETMEIIRMNKHCYLREISKNVDEKGNTPIHILCASLPVRVDQILFHLNQGVNVNATNDNSETALHVLCKSVCGDIVDAMKLLISFNVCQSVEDVNGCFAVEVLCRNHVSHAFRELISLLSSNGLRSRCLIELFSNENVIRWKKNMDTSVMTLTKQLIILLNHNVKLNFEAFEILDDSFEQEKKLFIELFFKQKKRN
jgi:hypothetical protein